VGPTVGDFLDWIGRVIGYWMIYWLQQMIPGYSSDFVMIVEVKFEGLKLMSLRIDTSIPKLYNFLLLWMDIRKKTIHHFFEIMDGYPENKQYTKGEDRIPASNG